MRREQSADPAEALAYYVAAVRELFEEAGVLLARPAGERRLIALDDEAGPRFEEYRRQLMAGALTLVDIAARERLRLALDALALFANWVTPEREMRRFDAWFFLAVAPPAQPASHHGHEASDGIWTTPAAAIDRCRRGDLALPPPTWTTLRAITPFDRVEGAWAWAQAHPIVRVQPRVNELPDGTREILLPGDAGYAPIAGFEPRETRFVLKGGRWLPVARGAEG